jgi:hypothetical protein
MSYVPVVIVNSGASLIKEITMNLEPNESVITVSSHDTFSPSSAERFMTCPASVKRSIGIPDSPSKYAQEGTNAHEYASNVLLGKAAFDPEQFEHLHHYINFCSELMTRIGMQSWVEERVYLNDELHGTPDFVCFGNGILHVVDLKYGYEAVPAANNKQLMYYAAAAIETYGISPRIISLTIVQPRLPNLPISTWVVETEYLNRFVVELHKAVAIAKEDNAPAKLGDHCKYCKAVPVCAERKAEVKKLFELECKLELDEQDIIWVLDRKDSIKNFLEKVEELAMAQPPKGYKVVPGVSRRYWKKDVQLPEQLLELTPISIGKAEKMGIEVEQFVELKEGGPRLVKTEASSELSKE